MQQKNRVRAAASMLEFGSVKAAEDEQELSVIEDAQNETETLGGTTN